MPITTGDIEFRLSGGAANSDPNASLGGAKSTTEIVQGVAGNLFDNVDSAEATAGSVKYRCYYVHNAHPTLDWQAPVKWIQSQTTSSDTSVDVGLGSSGVNGTEQTVVNEDTAPTAVTFTAPANKGSGLTMPNIPAGQHHAIWVRWTVNAGAAAFNDDTTVDRIEGDTAA